MKPVFDAVLNAPLWTGSMSDGTVRRARKGETGVSALDLRRAQNDLAATEALNTATDDAAAERERVKRRSAASLLSSSRTATLLG